MALCTRAAELAVAGTAGGGALCWELLSPTMKEGNFVCYCSCLVSWSLLTESMGEWQEEHSPVSISSAYNVISL